MLSGFKAFAVLGLIFSLLLAGCAIEATPAAGGAGPGPVSATSAATAAPANTAGPPAATPGATLAPTPAPVTASATPAPAATAQAPAGGSGSAAGSGAGSGVVVSSPVAPGSSGPLTGITPVPPATIVPVPTGGQLTVTLANNGATIRLHPGDRFVLMLGDTYNWEVTPADQNVVSRVVNITPLRGSQGVYEAHQVGQTTIEASGDPTCRGSQPPCMMPSIIFALKIVVE